MPKSLFARPIPLLVVLALLVVSAIGIATQDMLDRQPAESPIEAAAIDWLIGQQVEDGGFSAFGGESDHGSTADAVYALISAGIDPATVTSPGGNTPLDFLANGSGLVANDPGLAGKTVLALIAAGEDPGELLHAIRNGQNPETGFWGQSLTSHAYAMLALSAAGEQPSSEMVDMLLNSQIEDGSWGFTGATDPGTGDSNTTSLAVQALVAAGIGGEPVDRGIAYILTLEDATGAIAYDASEAPNITGDANSTAQAIQALVAAGHDASRQIAALEQFRAESGAFFWRSDWADDSLLATAQAIPALQEQHLPLQVKGR
jgi:hypothetical protein